MYNRNRLPSRSAVGLYFGDTSVHQKPINGSIFRWGVGPSLAGDSKSFQSQVDKKKADVAELQREKEQKMEDLKRHHLLHLTQTKQTIPTLSPEATTAAQRRPMGRKGYEQLTDYLIPVIRLIKSGVKHSDAFRRIADNLGVSKQTAQAECTVQLDHISTDKFVELINNGKIKSWLKQRFPDRASLIEKEI